MSEKLIKKILASIQEATKLHDEAEAAREKSDYTNIDALEQSSFNEGVISALNNVLVDLGEIAHPSSSAEITEEIFAVAVDAFDGLVESIGDPFYESINDGDTVVRREDANLIFNFLLGDSKPCDFKQKYRDFKEYEEMEKGK